MSDETAIASAAPATESKSTEAQMDANVLAARELIKGPEQASGVDAAREPIKSPENTSHAAEDASRGPLPKPEQSASQTHAAVPPQTVAVIPVHHSNVVTPEAFKHAEENLAGYLGKTLDPALTKGLLLTLSNQLSDSPEGRLGGTDLKLCLTGPMIEANFAEMSREVIQSLTQHPVLKSLLVGNHTLLIEQANSEDKGQMLHLHLPNLTAEKYAELIQSLGNAPAVQAKAHSDAIAEVSAINDTAVTKDASASAIHVDSPTEPTPPVMKEPKIEEPVIKQPVIAPAPTKAEADVPSQKVEAPVVQMGIQQPDTELKRA